MLPSFKTNQKTFMEQSNNLLDPKLGPLPKSDAIDTMNKILLVNDQENWRRR